MVGTIIFQDPAQDLTVTKHNKAIPEVYELIENMVWGTKGPRFYKINTQVKIDNSVKPDFLLLYIKEKFAGMCTISHRDVYFGKDWLPTYYLQFFAIKPEYQGKAYGNVLVESVRDHYASLAKKPTVSYAYIEGENVRSDKVAHFIKYKHASRFLTILFGRMFPKRSAFCRRFETSEKNKITALLKDYYKDYSFVHFEYAFNADNYWVLEKEGEILAGVQAHPQQWKFVNLPGWSGKFILNILPNIPIAKRLFNAKHHKFLCFESHYCKEGHEHDLVNLMEHCLAEYGKTSGMTWFDPRSPLFQKLDKLNPWGILDKIQGKHKANIYAKLHNIPESSWEDFTNKPFYIGAYDCV
jgi:N-acetylglutamate synthase-like GNAT family acetyltransferase